VVRTSLFKGLTSAQKPPFSRHDVRLKDKDDAKLLAILALQI
jgi:hypothetical protein